MLKKKLLAGVITAAVAVSAANAGETNSTKCVPLKDFTVEKAKTLLKEYLKGGVQVVGVTKSPIDTLYEVDVDVNGRRFPVYVDCGLNYLVMGRIIDIEKKKDLTRERTQELANKAIQERKKELSKTIGKEKVEKLSQILGPAFKEIKVADLKGIKDLDKSGTVILGNPNGKVTLYVIDDPECPFCAKLDEELKKLLQKRKDLKVEIILFPLSFHRHAGGISADIVCAKDNKEKAEILEKSFEAVRSRDIETLSKLAKEGEEKSKSCGKDPRQVISMNYRFAQSAGTTGTPTLIFPGGIVISGYMPADKIEKILDVLAPQK